MSFIKSFIPPTPLKTLSDQQISDHYTNSIYAFNRSRPGSEQHKALRLQMRRWQMVEHSSRTERYGMLAGFNWGKQEWALHKTPRPAW